MAARKCTVALDDCVMGCIVFPPQSASLEFEAFSRTQEAPGTCPSNSPSSDSNAVVGTLRPAILL